MVLMRCEELLEQLEEEISQQIIKLKVKEDYPDSHDEKICAESNYYGGMITGYKNILYQIERLRKIMK